MSVDLSEIHQTDFPPLAVPTEPVWQLSVEQYHEMIRVGILTENDPVELLDGWLVSKMPKNRPHSIATRRTCNTLERVVPTGWYVDCARTRDPDRE